MKKLTANLAKQLCNKSGREITSFQDAVNIIHMHTKLGMSNCFIDGKLSDLKVVKKELEERGFRCFIESVTRYDDNKFLTVEW